MEDFNLKPSASLDALLEEQDKIGTDDDLIVDDVIDPDKDEPVVPVIEKTEPDVVVDDPIVVVEDDNKNLQEAIDYFKTKTGIEDFEVSDDFTIEQIADIVVKEKEKIQSQYSVYEKDPDIKALAEWKAQGRTLDTFTAIPPAFNKDEFKLEDDQHKDFLITNYLKLKGLDEDDIDLNLTAAKADEDKYKKLAEKSLATLDTHVNKIRQEYLDNIDAQTTKAKEENKAFIDYVQANLNEGKLADGIIIGKEKAQEFNKMLTSPEYDAKWNSLTNDQKLILEYLVHTGFDFTPFGGKVLGNKAPARRGVSVVGKVTKTEIKDKTELSEEEQIARLRRGNLTSSTQF